MNLLSYIIWNGSPDIFSVGPITLRWYGLLFALGFLLSQQILYYIYKKEGKPEKDVDTLTIYMVIATIIGARLGHVFFYEPARYLANPIDIIKIWEGGLASHGAGVGIFIALWLYARKNRPGQSYLQVLDRIAILVALTGALIRLGNFANSEIIGKETTAGYGVVFTRNVTELLQRDPEVEKISYQSSDGAPNEAGYKPIKILVEFEADRQSEQELHMYMTSRFYDRIIYNTYINEHINQSTPIQYFLAKQDNGRYAAVVHTNAIARHPAQLYESISCLLLFILLYWMWNRQKENLPAGRIFGTFMIILWTLRFLYEYLKEVQVDTEISFINTYGINYGQLYSIPFVIFGIVVLVLSFRSGTQGPAINEKNS
ncbi:MAG: prolipoprotein diacylglyceryl transferase [Cyclobacteriaceae bacterium]|mgnify:CR=1 FL=1|nr:prolipoprotein diacylglyceryl transferase [Cyclobacteriaceae bacterium]